MEHYNQTTDIFLDAPVVYAGFWERFGALFLDALILMIPQFLIGYFLPYGLSNVVSLLLGWLYFAAMESGEGQATIGKRALGMKVTGINGERISFGQATGRYFAKILSGIILFIGYLMMLWDDKKQTLHDKLAGALVVKA